MMPPQRFAEEILYRIQKFGIYDFYISDLVFMQENMQRTEKMIELLIEIKQKYPDFSWRAEYRLQQLKRSGCRHIKFGVEMMNEEMLKKMNKGITIQQIEKAFQMTKKAGISRTAYILLGCPGFEDKDYQEMWLKFKKLNADNYVVNICVPYMGTQLYTMMEDKLSKCGLFQNGEEGYIHVSKIMQEFWKISDETMDMYFLLAGSKEDQIHRDYRRKIVDKRAYDKTGKIAYEK